MDDATPATVLEAVQLLEREGYDSEFLVRPDGLRCRACGGAHLAARAVVDRVYRFEGPSDPDEEAIVLALRCPVCGASGMVVSAYGPGADPGVLDSLVLLDDRFRHPS